MGNQIEKIKKEDMDDNFYVPLKMRDKETGEIVTIGYAKKEKKGLLKRIYHKVRGK